MCMNTMREVIWILTMRCMEDRKCIKFNYGEITLLLSCFVGIEKHISVVVLHI